MCDQWSDITLWWNILTPLEARGCDKGGSKAARQQHQRQCKKGSDDWFLSQQWQATARLHYTSKTSEVGEISSFSCSRTACFWPQFREEVTGCEVWLGNISELLFLSQAHFWVNIFSDVRSYSDQRISCTKYQESQTQDGIFNTWAHTHSTQHIPYVNYVYWLEY